MVSAGLPPPPHHKISGCWSNWKFTDCYVAVMSGSSPEGVVHVRPSTGLAVPCSCLDHMDPSCGQLGPSGGSM